MWQRLTQQIKEIPEWLKKQFRNNPLGSFSITLLSLSILLFLIWIVWETYKAKNMGFADKTFWSWMELLIIPVVLAAGAILFNLSERRSEQRITTERFQEEVLREYLDRMTELLLEKGLLTSELESEVRVAARAQTLTTFRILDGNRKGVILKFLFDAKLIERKSPKVFLNGSDLSGTNLIKASIYDANLLEIDMHKADLSGAKLCGSWMTETNLSEAILKDADLRDVNFSGANLSSANLHGALLIGTVLLDADLTKANLSMAEVSEDELHRAKSLKGARMPDGRVHE